MTQAQATYSSDEMTVNYTATLIQDSYGVRGSDFESVDNIEAHSIEILGVDVRFDSLSTDLQTAILELINEDDFEPD